MHMPPGGDGENVPMPPNVPGPFVPGGTPYQPAVPPEQAPAEPMPGQLSTPGVLPVPQQQPGMPSPQVPGMPTGMVVSPTPGTLPPPTNPQQQAPPQ
jgi:hypothetical protein